MTPKFNCVLCALIVTALIPISTTVVDAQVSNRPFQFNTSGSSGLGMSIGGKQAILNQELFGATPRNLLRNQSGELVGVESGPRRVPIVTAPGGQFIPGFRRTFRDRSPGLRVGVFNASFVPEARLSSNAALLFDDFSGANVDIWTVRVLSRGAAGFAFRPGDPVTSWTGYVYALEPLQPVSNP